MRVIAQAGCEYVSIRTFIVIRHYFMEKMSLNR